MKENTCCFLGHREINETEELKMRLYEIIEDLIKNKNVDTFLFGSKSRFDDLCYEIVTHIKQNRPNIKRIYVRAEYPVISDSYQEYLLKSYEDTYYPESIIGSGRAVYVERNCEMIKKSQFCIFYYNEDYIPATRKSGTRIALDYALKQNKKVIVINA